MITKNEDVAVPKLLDYPGVKESTRRILAEEERRAMKAIRKKALKNYDAKQLAKKSMK